MKKVFCLRGLPGSGKNTWIESNQKTYWRHKKVVVCSADDYHMVNGEYKFDPSMIGEAHNSCLRKFLVAVGSDIEIVVVNNTNISAWEIAPYAAIAKAMGYEFEIVQIQCSVQKSISRNTHGVAPETIGAMAESMRREILPGQWSIKKITDDITVNDDIAKFLDAFEKRGIDTCFVERAENGVEENVVSRLIVSIDRDDRQTLYLIPSYVPTYKGVSCFVLNRQRIPEIIQLIETASSVCTPYDIEEAVCIMIESQELPCECGVKGEWEELHYPSIHE